ncbi:MAG TPA: helix-turn-helix transcriptional regulator [Nitrospiraceae bacterium]|jgi:transcriptional regulator with XRE-family HTH domain|nr:helix-turn-helix transcriptional regulator [Nitrospiraceae bacterium]
MSIGSHLQAWRLYRGQAADVLARNADLPVATVEAIEAGELDPLVSTLEALATALKVPVPWLFGNPKDFELLFERSEEEGEGERPLQLDGVDPVTERIVFGSRCDRSLYALLTALIQNGNPKLLRAAEVSLRSLVKQSRQAAVPWQSRPPGHFEPPSD